jgi:hypothetical protein
MSVLSVSVLRGWCRSDVTSRNGPYAQPAAPGPSDSMEDVTFIPVIFN